MVDFLPNGPRDVPERSMLTALLASVADAVYAVDHVGRVSYVNRAALEILRFPEVELLGQPSHATIHYRRPDGSSFPESTCPLLRPRVTGETVRVDDDWFVRRDGTMVPVSYSSAPFPTTGGRGAVVVFRDDTARREAEEAVRREAAERTRADALASSRSRILEAADAERRRLGRDLHDGAQQRLMNVAMAVGNGLRLLDERPADARSSLQDALAESRTTLAELRELAAGIHPTILSTRGLRAAIEGLTARTPFPVAVDVTDQRFTDAVEIAAYYVVSEALANVAKHAEATAAFVTVRVEGGRLEIAVVDNGRGGADLAAGRGLRGLADRMEAVGGTLAVTDDPGGGTRVTASVLPAERRRATP